MSSISGVGGYNTSMMYSAMKMQRPDTSQMAEKLFSQLDTKGQGYIEKSDLESAFGQVSSGNSASSGASVDDVFSQLDGDGNGKVTEQELADALKKLSDSMGEQGGPGGMPPPPPPDEANGGLTKDQLTSMAKEIGSSDSQRSELLNKLVENFDQADTNGDGKVSREEAMNYDKSSSGDSSRNGSTSTAASGGQDVGLQVMQRIMQIMHAYGSGEESNGAAHVSVSV